MLLLSAKNKVLMKTVTVYGFDYLKQKENCLCKEMPLSLNF